MKFIIRFGSLKIYNENGAVEVIDNLTFQLKANQKKYNRYKVGHPSGFLEAFANMYSDYSDEFIAFKKNKKHKGSKKVLDFKNSEAIAKFFHSASASHKKNRWVKI